MIDPPTPPPHRHLLRCYLLILFSTWQFMKILSVILPHVSWRKISTHAHAIVVSFETYAHIIVHENWKHFIFNTDICIELIWKKLVCMFEVFFTSELVSGSKIALFSTNLRYQALTQRWNAARTCRVINTICLLFY